MQINQSTLDALYKGYRVIYMAEYQGAASGIIDRAAMMTTSKSAEEFYKWLGAVPGMREFLGEADIQNLAANGFSIMNKTFHDTVGIPREDIERDNYGIYNPMFSAMGEAARQHPDSLLADMILNGFGRKCYTGKNFFDSNHEPQKGGTKFSNVGNKKLSAANFVVGRANIKSRLNAKGRPMNLGKDLVLVVSPNYEDVGRKIVVADMVASAAGTASETNVNKGTARLEVWPELAANPDAWFILEMGKVIKPFINQVEKKTEFNAATNVNTENVMLFQKFLYQAYGRYNVGYGLPELAYGSDGSQAA